MMNIGQAVSFITTTTSVHFETWLQMEGWWGFDFSNASTQHNQEKQRQEHKCSKGPTEFQTNRKAGKQWESWVGNAL